MANNRAPDIFASSTQKSSLWLKDLQSAGHLDSQAQAYSALRCVLHSIRDCLRPAEAVKLAAQLPLFIKGVYFDGWSLGSKPERLSREAFLDRIRKGLIGQPEIDPILALESVLQTVYRHVSAGELDSVRLVLPREVRGLIAQRETRMRRDEGVSLPRRTSARAGMRDRGGPARRASRRGAAEARKERRTRRAPARTAQPG